MKPEIFFQKNDTKIYVKILKRLYFFFFMRSNKARIKYLRDSGAKIGEDVNINNIDILGSEPCLIEIGNHVYFSGDETRILTHDGSAARMYFFGLTDKIYDIFGKVKIGDNCFIGIKTIILPGVEIGENCIIGAGSVVTKSIPANSIACGVPARVISSVEQYYQKHKANFEDTIGWNRFDKRIFLEGKYLNKDSSGVGI